MKNSALLFTYGTMKRGFSNHERLEGAAFRGVGTTLERYAMYPAIHYRYPYVVADETKYRIKGEVFELPSSYLEEVLDRFEGVPLHYVRSLVDIEVGAEVYRAHMYFRSASCPMPCDELLVTDEWTPGLAACSRLFESYAKHKESL